jgi:hypothetical protein
MVSFLEAMTVTNVVFVFSRISEEEEVMGDTSSASPSTLTHPATPTSISGELPRGISYQGPHGLHLPATSYYISLICPSIFQKWSRFYNVVFYTTILEGIG